MTKRPECRLNYLRSTYHLDFIHHFSHIAMPFPMHIQYTFEKINKIVCAIRLIRSYQFFREQQEASYHHTTKSPAWKYTFYFFGFSLLRISFFIILYKLKCPYIFDSPVALFHNTSKPSHLIPRHIHPEHHLDGSLSSSLRQILSLIKSNIACNARTRISYYMCGREVWCCVFVCVMLSTNAALAAITYLPLYACPLGWVNLPGGRNIAKSLKSSSNSDPA